MTGLFEALERFFLPFAAWMAEHRAAPLEIAAKVVSFTGEELFLLFLWPLVHWCWSPAVGRRLLPAFFLSLWSNFWLKEVFGRPRPAFYLDPAPEHATDFGVPSGHGQNVPTLWGGIALELKGRGGAQVAIAIYCVLVAFSRIVLGVHFLHDTLIGLALAAITLVAYAKLEPKVSAWFVGLSIAQRCGVVLGVAGALAAIHPFLDVPVADHGASRPAMALGLFVGFSLGAIVELAQAHGGFVADGTPQRRFARYAVGLALLFALHFGMKSLFKALVPDGSAWLVLTRYLVLGAFMALVAPWIFVRTKLANAAAIIAPA